MPTASVVATELRRIADGLDKEPEVAIPQPLLSFYCRDFSGSAAKDAFLALARILPKPFVKETTDSEVEIGHGKGNKAAVWFRAVVDRSLICTLIEPAKPAVYDCPALLSEEEEAGLTEGSNA